MQIVNLTLNNFRCFRSFELDLNNSIALLTGPNGSGKTSIIEALHYSCYLRSFKTHITKDLVNFDSSELAVTTNIASEHSFDTLQVKFSKSKRTVKLNQKPINSFNDLYNTYKVVTISENDLDIVQAGPSIRRSFLDQIIFLINPSYANTLRKYIKVLANRNSLLSSYTGDYESYALWTSQIFPLAKSIQKERKEIINILINELKLIVSNILNKNLDVSISYRAYHSFDEIKQDFTIEEMIRCYPNLFEKEVATRRSQFGPHLDDIEILFNGKSARVYASRGQQKYILFLLKLAKLQYLSKVSENKNVILLVDDFFTDFDEHRYNMFIDIMPKLASQVIITSALNKSFLEQKISDLNAQIIRLDQLNNPNK